MFIVITKNKIWKNNSLKGLNNKLSAAFDLEEFRQVGNDYVITLDDIDLEFVRDKRKMENLALSSLYKKDTTVKIMFIVMLLIQFIIFVKVGAIK